MRYNFLIHVENFAKLGNEGRLNQILGRFSVYRFDLIDITVTFICFGVTRKDKNNTSIPLHNFTNIDLMMITVKDKI